MLDDLEQIFEDVATRLVVVDGYELAHVLDGFAPHVYRVYVVGLRVGLCGGGARDVVQNVVAREFGLDVLAGDQLAEDA